MRKIIQISADGHHDAPSVFALCDDNTVWSCWLNPRTQNTPLWHKLPDIPQDTATQEDANA